MSTFGRMMLVLGAFGVVTGSLVALIGELPLWSGVVLICGGVVLFVVGMVDQRGRARATITRKRWRTLKIVYWGVLFPVGVVGAVWYESCFGEHPWLLGVMLLLIYVALFLGLRMDARRMMVDGKD
jgi:uncharacterized membrane protein AbrB (regulator of aidB expression)